MYFKYVYLCLWALAVPAPSYQFVSDDVNDVFDLTTRVLEVVAKSWVMVEKVEERSGDENTPLAWYMKKKERMLLNNLGRISQLVLKTQRETDDIRSMMLGSLQKLQSLPKAVINGIQVNELLESVRSLENDYTTMTDYNIGENDNYKTKVNQTYSSYTLEKFADAMLSYSSGSPHKQMAKIHSFIVPEWEGFKFHTHGGIFNILKHTLEDSDMLCEQKQSLQQLIFNLYKTLHMTQLKGFSVMQFSWMFLQNNGKGNFSYERNQQREKFEQKIIDQLSALKTAMSSASNRYWRCDPERHISGLTYVEVTQLLQGYIENEADMNYEQSCMNNCGYYEVAEHKSCFKDQFCAKQRTCNGRILNCQFFDSDMKLCQSKFGSNRRYDYISYKNGKVLGDVGECKGTMSKVDSWWVYLLWHCSYCFCICDSSDSASDRYFSLKPSVSNIDQNKVVTGVKITKVNQMFHLQVQEGELGARGSINESTRHWVPVPGREFSYRNTSLKNGIDYHTLTYTERAIDLDEVIAHKNEIVTGIRLRMIGSHLNLEVQVTPFNFITGVLDKPELSRWIGNDKTELSAEPRTEIDISNSDLPTKSGLLSEPDMSSNKFLKFTHSSIDQDVAQTTLPFIDIQPVTPYPGVPFSGMGLYFKGTKNFAGFIGAKVFTYDSSDDINMNLFSKFLIE